MTQRPLSELAKHMLPVAKLLWGDPRPHAKSNEVRFGDGRTIDPTKGTWYDHPAHLGGGVLDLIKAERGLEGRAAIEWMAENGLEIEDRRPPLPPRSNAPIAARAPQGGDDARLPPGVPPHAEMTAAYDYNDEGGEFIFQVCRFEWVDPEKGNEKTFRQRRKDPNVPGGWSWSVKGCRQVPYRAIELVEAIAAENIVFIVEGEKDVENLNVLGVPATCNAMGAGKFPEPLLEFFRGANVVIIPDNDEPGRKHKDTVATRLHGVAARVRVLELPDLPPKGDTSDWIAAGGTVDQLYQLVEEKARDWRPADDYKSKFGAVVLADLDKPGAEHEHLIKGILTRGETSMLVGPSGSGKSFLATHMSLCIARGEPFLTVTAGARKYEPRVRKGGVLYIAGEGARGLKKRLRAYLQYWKADPRTVPFVLLTLPVDLHGSEEPTQHLIDEIKHYGRAFAAEHGVGIELVVIDTLSSSTPGANENASDDVSRILGRCHRVAETTNTAVMLVHHMNASGQRERGHSSLRANVDSVIEVQKSENAKDANGRILRSAKITKQKDGEDGIHWQFVLPSVKLGEDLDGDPITSCVVDLPAAGEEAEQGQAKIYEMRGQNSRLIFETLLQVRRERGQTTPVGCSAPIDERVIHIGDWREAFERRAPFDDEDTPERRQERVKKAMQRALTDFQNLRLIQYDNPWIWLTGRPVKGFSYRMDWKPQHEREAEDPPPPLTDENNFNAEF